MKPKNLKQYKIFWQLRIQLMEKIMLRFVPLLAYTHILSYMFFGLVILLYLLHLSAFNGAVQ